MAVLKYRDPSTGQFVAITNYTVQPVVPVQTTGTSTTDIMSQKAVTDALNLKANSTDITEFFDGAVYTDGTGTLEGKKVIAFKHGNVTKVQVDATDFIKDGMVESAEVVTISGVRNLRITWNNDSGKTSVTDIPIGDIFDADNYVTKAEGVTNVAYDETNKKLTKTINGVTSDVVTAASLKSDMSLDNVVNTGDSATPVENGTTKFTTGGAYTELNKKADKVSMTQGTYKSVTVNAQGIVTDGSNPTTLAGYGITDAASSTHVHGNIGNGGALTDTAAASAVDDCIVIRDASDNKIQTSTTKGTDVADAINKKHTHNNITLSTTAQAYDDKEHTIVLPASDPYNTARTPISHTHGNISNTGTLTDTAADAADNDYLVIRDASDNKIQTSTIKGVDVVDAISKKHSHSNKDELDKIVAGNVDSWNSAVTGGVTSVAYDTADKKITKTINSETSDVVTASDIVTDGGGIKAHATHKLTTVNGDASAVSQGTEITYIESLTGTTTATSGDLSVTATRKKITVPAIPASLPANGGNADTVDNFHFMKISQSDYDNLTTKDSNTFYIID